MPSIKDYNVKILSLKSTVKLTSAMKMIASTKLHKTFATMDNSKTYSKNLNKVLGKLGSIKDKTDSVYIKGHAEIKKANIILFTGDKGLCGSHNSGTIKKALALAENLIKKGITPVFSFVGKKGFLKFKKFDFETHNNYENRNSDPRFSGVLDIASDLMDSFASNQYQEVWIVYNSYNSPIDQEPEAEQILPLSTFEEDENSDTKGSTQQEVDYIIEPSVNDFTDQIIPKLINFRLYHTLLKSVVSEHGARMTAMDAATTNGQKMMDKYIRLRNRARQTAITTELTEIVAGKEAL